jgi:hypothetical protein
MVTIRPECASGVWAANVTAHDLHFYEVIVVAEPAQERRDDEPTRFQVAEVRLIRTVGACLHPFMNGRICLERLILVVDACCRSTRAGLVP